MQNQRRAAETAGHDAAECKGVWRDRVSLPLSIVLSGVERLLPPSGFAVLIPAGSVVTLFKMVFV